MGAFLTKVAPVKDKEYGEAMTTMPTMPNKSTPNKFLDPRSPNPFRTPISELPFNDAKPVSKAQDLTNNDNISTLTAITPTKLKNKLLRDLGYWDPLDPRSPALNFDRTPLNFYDSNMSEDFSLAELSLNESDVETSIKENPCEHFYTPDNVKFAQLEIDPRSPSIDIERTPLNLNVLLDDTQEDQSLQANVEEEARTPIEEIVSVAVIETVKNMIYMDENQEQPTTPTTVKAENIDKIGKIRTPLSCLVNTQGADNRHDKRSKMQNKTSLARSIFKDTALPANKMNTPLSKIPVLRRSLSKEIN